MQKQISGETNTIMDFNLLQQAARQLLEQISKRDKKIAEYQRLGNNQEEKISSLQQTVQDLTTQVAALTTHTEGLEALVAQKDFEIQEIFNSNSWKVAIKLQKIRNLLVFGKNNEKEV